MAKDLSKQRPGVVFRFGWLKTLEKLSAEAQGRFLMDGLRRGQDPSNEINLDGLSQKDVIRLDALWDQAAPAIDADGEGWANGIIQRRYAAYVSKCKKDGEDPMSYEEFKTWYKTMETRDQNFQ